MCWESSIEIASQKLKTCQLRQICWVMTTIKTFWMSCVKRLPSNTKNWQVVRYMCNLLNRRQGFKQRRISNRAGKQWITEWIVLVRQFHISRVPWIKRNCFRWLIYKLKLKNLNLKIKNIKINSKVYMRLHNKWTTQWTSSRNSWEKERMSFQSWRNF